MFMPNYHTAAGRLQYLSLRPPDGRFFLKLDVILNSKIVSKVVIDHVIMTFNIVAILRIAMRLCMPSNYCIFFCENEIIFEET